jgi:hypothetical protein
MFDFDFFEMGYSYALDDASIDVLFLCLVWWSDNVYEFTGMFSLVFNTLPLEL